MKIVKGWPPNINRIWEKFDLWGQQVVFTYGDTIYNPSGGPVYKDLEYHEQVHEFMQAQLGVEQWWEQYLNDEKFRLEQEVLAYRVQYDFCQKNSSRQVARQFLHKISKDLAGPVYGQIITADEAEKLICQTPPTAPTS